MPVQITCPKCESSFTVADTLRGKRVRCRNCQGAIPVPGARAAAPEPAEDDDAPRVKPKKKPKKQSGISPVVWIGGAAGAVAIIAVVVVVIVASSGSGGGKGTVAGGDGPAKDAQPGDGKGPGQGNPQLPQRSQQDAATTMQNLKRISLAILAFNDKHKHFPPAAILSKDGRPLLSWRVALLPFMGEDGLFSQFKLDEPWDGPNNAKLLSAIPHVYQPAGLAAAKPGTTLLQTFVGPDTAWPTQPSSGTLLRARGLTLATIARGDGASNTLGVIEAHEPVPWTKPDDMRYDPKQPLPRVGGHFDRYYLVMLDGNVRVINQPLDEKTLRGIITPGGGEIVSLP